MAEDKIVRKAYDNREFLHGRSARHLRVLAEFIEPEERLRKYDIHNTIVFFGSAQSVDNRAFKERKLDKAVVPQKALDLSNAHEACIELARRITVWSQTIEEPVQIADLGLYQRPTSLPARSRFPAPVLPEPPRCQRTTVSG